MAKVIKKQLYKLTRDYGMGEFIEADGIDDLALYVANALKNGEIIRTIAEVNLDGSHPRIAINKYEAFKNAMR